MNERTNRFRRFVGVLFGTRQLPGNATITSKSVHDEVIDKKEKEVNWRCVGAVCKAQD